MKIAIITNLYPPYSRGGAEVVITRTVTELLAQGHEVSVITTRPFTGVRSFLPRLEDDSNERIYRFYPFNLYHPLRDHRHWWCWRLLWHIIDAVNPLNGFFVWKTLREIAPDVVWTHNLKGIGLTIPLFLRRGRAPWVHQVHDVQLSVPSGLTIAGHERMFLTTKLFRHGYTLFCRLLFGSPTAIISPSRFLLEFYAQKGFFKKSRMVTMPNPAPKEQLLARGLRSAGPVRLLFVGQLEYHKGIKFLINTLQHCAVPFQLAVAGEGTQEGWILEMAKKDKRITYVGFLAMDQLNRLFQISDALVVPSCCYENSPTVIYEALQAGLPVVAANIGGVAELIQPGTNGYLFTPQDQDSLCRAIMTLDEDKEWIRASADQIQATVADYAIDKYVARVVELFEQMGSGLYCCVSKP